MRYRPRIVDDILTKKMMAFGAIWIQGPKGCGKTTSGRHKAKTIVEFQDEDKRDNLLMIAATSPKKLLIGEKPILFDEWQDAPKLFGAIRKDVDDSGDKGQYILTGSSSNVPDTPHTGTL
ncbi:MAG: AAA family ATPase, partial [Spirochaetales bacterium]|nr:AAA family ATPase [Spirochaetales bacterium]